MLLNSLCMLDVVRCTPRTTALEAAYLMRNHHVGDLVVVQDEEGEREPLGVITDRDIVVEVLAKGLDPATTLVGSVMKTPVVGRDGALVGIVTADDMLRRLTADAGLLSEMITRQRSLEERRAR